MSPTLSNHSESWPQSAEQGVRVDASFTISGSSGVRGLRPGCRAANSRLGLGLRKFERVIRNVLPYGPHADQRAALVRPRGRRACPVVVVGALASDHRLDLRRTVTVGHSAGGQLALWADARPRLPAGAPGGRPRVRVTHAVAQAGVFDLHAAACLDLSGGAVRDLLGPRWAELASRTSPLELVPLGVPQLLVHGAADDDVPPDLSRRDAERARAAGDAVTLVVGSGVGHYEHLDPGSSGWRRVRSWLRKRIG